MTAPPTLEVDVAVVGGGSAGMAAYRAAVAAGARTVLIEGGDFGTTCARVGCMPSKLLIAAADAAHAGDTASDFGLPAPAARAGDALAGVMDRVRRERDRFVGFVLREVDAYPATDKLAGVARFVGGHVLVVTHANGDATRVHAGRIVLATGSVPVVPRELDAVRALCLTTDSLFELPHLPASAAIVGTGVVALELGQALHRLGVRVRLFGRGGRLGVLTDPEVHRQACAVWADALPLDCDARAVFHADGGEVRVDYVTQDGSRASERFACVIAAAGRAPRLPAGLETTSWGAAVAAGGWRFDRTTMQVGASPVFVAGDASGEDNLLHEAVDEGRIAGRNAASFPRVRGGERRARLSIAFTDPQMAIVGGGWALAQRAGDVVVGQASFANQGRSRVMLRNRGLLRVYADRAGFFLGAEMFGPDAEHLGHLMAWALQARMRIDQMLSMPFYHPVVEEGLRTALRDARRSARTEA
ncbi:Mercuric reductase [Variovorax sp. SRS16]|uniref:dihydrolipoyl dehydrogenase n=1 Tax=Variovorax sp. SRS16 TaxID=282217 RepID=UPI00131919FA|nr:dihydrolipoyl dehydrogenase [Variovorax sp. SRS16]VTU14459.1 Mercuric reductase [Variovorax sp. SRS16]